MRFNTANSSLVSGSGLVLSIYQICAYGSRDQAEFVPKISDPVSDGHTKAVRHGIAIRQIKDRPEAVRCPVLAALGSSRARRGGTALTISEVESGDLVSG
jgi:hypothetical protein